MLSVWCYTVTGCYEQKTDYHASLTKHSNRVSFMYCKCNLLSISNDITVTLCCVNHIFSFPFPTQIHKLEIFIVLNLISEPVDRSLLFPLHSYMVLKILSSNQTMAFLNEVVCKRVPSLKPAKSNCC